MPQALRIPWLDGVRGLAALQVFLLHFSLLHTSRNHSYNSTPTDTHLLQLPLFRPLYLGGDAATCVFFIISGIALTTKPLTLLHTGNSPQIWPSLSRNILKRPFRLYLPVFAVGLVGVVLVRIFDLTAGGYIEAFEVKGGLWEQLADFLVKSDDLFNPVSNVATYPVRVRYPYVPTAWTIPMELQGSLVCYLILGGLARIKDHGRRYMVIVVCSLYTLHRGTWWVSLFLNGMLMEDLRLRDALRDRELPMGRNVVSTSSMKRDVAKSLRQVVFLAIFCSGFYLAETPPPAQPEDGDSVRRAGYEALYVLVPPYWLVKFEDPVRWLWYLSSVFIMVGISQVDCLRALFEKRTSQRLGQLSFMLYLTHPVVIAAVRSFARYTISRIPVGVELEIACGLALTTSVALWVAIMMERYLETSCGKVMEWIVGQLVRDLI